ncbi:MAG: Gfo/Idh/MocA family oxidoreductase [Clostridia bacterium]|nr:Gfo/Idh/MocA family oxidoreductase [Clostridia bacterium]
MEKKIRLGIIGAGNFSVSHICGIKNLPFAELVAICDINPEAVKERAETYGIPHTYTDYKKLLERDDVDAVTLPLPDQVHAKIAVDAMRAGKHVLCEKPMALSREDCSLMVQTARQTGMQLMVGQVGRYTPAFVKAKEIVESGEIGELTFMEAEYAHDYSKIGGRGGWRITPERHPILGGGCHAIDLVRMIAGNPEEVFAYANNKVLVDWPINDTTIAVMKFSNGVIGKVFNSHGCKRAYTMRTVVQGTKGTLIFDNTNPWISVFKEELRGDDMFLNTRQQTVEMRVQLSLNNHNVEGEIADFCRCITEGKPVTTDGVEGASTVAVGLAIVESVEKGLPVKVDYEF